MKIRTVIIIALTAFASVPEAPSAGSKFGLNFLGDRLDAGDVRSIALGSDLQLIPDSLAVLQANPAAMTFIRRVTVGAVQFVSSNRSKSEGLNEQAVSVKYPAFKLAVPLDDRVTFGIGYIGRYDPGSSFSIEEMGPSGDIYKNLFTRSGGLYSIPFTLALSLSEHLSVGMFYSLERGSIEDKWTILFKDPGFVPGLGLRRTEFSGSGYGGGAVVFPKGPVMVGAVYESGIDYDTEVFELFSLSKMDSSYASRVKIPYRVSFSVTWRLSSTWMILGSAALRDFKDFEGLDFPPERLRREERYALGVEFNRGTHMPLRFSAAFETLPYEYPAGEKINTSSASLGTSLHLRGGKGKIDIALQAGRTGSLGRNGLEDRFLRFYFSLAGGEVWKRHRADR